jgi:hypothetical protein
VVKYPALEISKPPCEGHPTPAPVQRNPVDPTESHQRRQGMPDFMYVSHKEPDRVGDEASKRNKPKRHRQKTGEHEQLE